MKKLLLLFLFCSVTSSHTMDQEPPKEILPKEKKLLVDREPKNRHVRKACLLGLLAMAISGVGLAADITTRVEADLLNSQVSPITAYPAYLFAGDGYPFINSSSGLTQKVNCSYTAYSSSDAGLTIPPYKGECPCFRGFGCACTLEECPPGQEYVPYFYNQLGCNITSICTRLIAFLGIGGWVVNKWRDA